MKEEDMNFLELGVDTKIEGANDHIYMIVFVKFLGLQVCTTIPPDDIVNLDLLQLQVNKDYTCGTEHGWVIELEDPAPGKCADVDGRHHYIFKC